jgi:hypothetical protein
VQQSLTPAVDGLDSLIRPGRLLLVVSDLFSFMGGVRKKQITKHGCKKYFCRVTFGAPLEMQRKTEEENSMANQL